jgi:hypothetical protein
MKAAAAVAALGKQVEAPKSQFSQADPKLQIAWDSVSMNLLLDCPRKYQYQILDGWVPKKTAPPLEFGILFHRAVEFLETRRASGMDYEKAVHETVAFILKRSWGFVGDSDKPSGWVRTRFTLIRAFVWYADKYRSDHAKTIILKDGKPATELSFRIAIPLTTPDGEQYILCGHIDRVVRFGEEVMIDDYKTSASTISSHWFTKFTPNWQMSNYIFGGYVILPEAPTGALIDAAQLAVGFTRFARGKTERTPSQIDEWLDNTMYLIKMAERFAEDEYWPMNEQSCHHYGGCVFRDICAKDPSVREKWLEAGFKRDQWNPLKNRGE